MSSRLLNLIALSTLTFATLHAANGAEPKPEATTVALTIAVPTNVSAENRELATSLLTLLELEVAQDSRLSVVERRQIELVLHELALSIDLSKSSEKKVRLVGQRHFVTGS
jgi:hypothetical protein